MSVNERQVLGDLPARERDHAIVIVGEHTLDFHSLQVGIHGVRCGDGLCLGVRCGWDRCKEDNNGKAPCRGKHGAGSLNSGGHPSLQTARVVSPAGFENT